MSLKSLVSRAIPAAIGFVTGGPAGAVGAAISTEQTKKAQRQVNQKIAEENRRRQEFMETSFGRGSSISTINANLAATTPVVSTASSGGGFLDTIRGGINEVGGFVSDVFSSGIPQLFGVTRPSGIPQQPAFTTTGAVGAQETQGSGSVTTAGAGFLTPAIQAGRALLKSPAGQLALGTGAGIGAGFLSSSGKKMRITRKMKSQARTVLNIAGGNISVAADILNISEEMLITILLKRFRNDGPVVTKAALRKTKSTIRRLHSMQDVLKSITPTAAGRRRAPMKRAMSTTLIKN